MNKEFHYWVTALLAHRAGFADDEVSLIAYCSQFVDDNDREIEVFSDEFAATPCYRNSISQTMNILLPRTDLMDIYPVFHFIPGDQAKAVERKDGKVHVLNTTPGSSNAVSIVGGALDAYGQGDRLGIYRLGVASHAFVDTWAHQNFAGCCDDFNALPNILLPNVGHADAIHHPDWVAHRWIDDRLKSPEIDNNGRYLGAARALYELFNRALGKSPAPQEWKTLQQELLGIWKGTYSGDDEKGGDTRVNQYRSIVPWLQEYDDGAFYHAALRTEYVPVPGSDSFADRHMWRSNDDFSKTRWFLFQEAVKAHLSHAREVLEQVFALAGTTP